jgi:hypothetical protein
VADVVEKRPGAEIISPPRSRHQEVQSRRFAMVLLLVMVLFAGLLGAFAYLMSRSDASEAAWSSYKPPPGEMYESAQSLADYIAPRYISNGDPIAVVQAQPPIFQQAEVAGIAFMQRPNQGVGTAYRQFEPADNTMMYVFCGPAAACALPERGEDLTPLLRRQSLELALYTFKYWPDVNSVVALLPPTEDQKPAFLFRRKDLREQLSRPLQSTLPKSDEITTTSMTEGELATVEALTEDKIFLSSFQQTANGQTILLLGSGSR